MAASDVRPDPTASAARAAVRPTGRGKGTLVPSTIRGKLFVVFAAISLSAAIGALIAERANVLVQRQLALITEDSLPSLVTAHQISEATTNIRNMAVAMATSESEPALASRRRTLEEHIASARAVVAALGETGIDATTTITLARQMDEVEELTSKLAAVVASRLTLAEERTENVQRLATEHQAFNEAIRPLINEALRFLDRTGEQVKRNTAESVEQLNDISFKGLIPVLSINAQLVSMKEALRDGATAMNEAQIDTAWGEFVAASSVISRHLETLGNSTSVRSVVDIEQLEAKFRHLQGFGTGDASLFDKRRRDLGAAPPPGGLAPVDTEAPFKEFELLLQLSITLIRGETANVGIDLNRAVADALVEMNEASVDGYGALLQLEALGNRAVGLLTVATSAANLDDIEPLRRDLQTTNNEFASALARLRSERDASDTVALARSLMNSGQGERNLLELRTIELLALSQADDLLLRTNVLTQQMSTVAAEIVTSARNRVDAAAAEVVDSLHTSRTTLLFAIGLSFLAILGAVLYVNRSLGSRLGAFSNAALALAEGDLSIRLPEPAGQDEVARLMRALVVFRDTAVEMKESNLREIAEMRQRLIDAIESISEGFAFFDADERLVIANSRCREVFLSGVIELVRPGVGMETLLRAVVDRGLVVEAAEQPEAWLAWRLARFREPQGPFTLEYRDGSWVQISERKTADEGTVVVYTDITDLKQRELQLMHAKEAAEAANEAKSSFLANVSHELRTPLTSILGFARIVQKRFMATVVPALQADAKEVARARGQIERNLEIILLEGERLTKLVNDVLDLEKIEAGEMTWNVASLDVGELVEQAAAATESLYRQKGLAFAIDVPPDLPQILGDRDRVIQVLINLISNAVKFTNSGTITCRVDVPAADRVQVSVSDTGVGIDSADLGAIFEKFRQVGDTLTEKPSGTGLGLPICREIVEHLGGGIEVVSERGRGSTFAFWLPSAACGGHP